MNHTERGMQGRLSEDKRTRVRQETSQNVNLPEIAHCGFKAAMFIQGGNKVSIMIISGCLVGVTCTLYIRWV